MKSKKILFVIQSIAGIILLLLGGFVLTAENVKMFSGLCIGVGAAMTALGIGWFIQSLIIPAMESEEIKRINTIELKDERNTSIREKTGYMVAKIMNYLLLAFVLILGFMGVDKMIIIMSASLIAIEFLLVIYFSNYYSKKM